jgi:peptidoglycan hydrolase-like protein with peptidoglycan-binding domain
MTVLDPALRDAPEKGTRARRRWRVLFAATAVIALGVAAALIVMRDGSGGRPPVAVAPATADVVRTDLAGRTRVDGTLGYAGTYTVTAAGQGRLTWLPAVGSVIGRGQQMYGVNGRKVPLLYGPTPLWRELKNGVADGRDVRELEGNLAALGYGGGLTVDGHFSYATTAAVKRWQEDLGVAETGIVDPGDVVVRPAALRVTAVSGVVDGVAQGTLLTASGTTRQITVNLPVAQQELAATGAKVRIDLPGGKTATGRISKVGTVASSGSTGSGGSGGGGGGGPAQTGQGTETATIPVYITLDRPSAAGRLDGAPVTVGFTSSLRKGVLAVPVNALLASPGGGYAVAVVDSFGRARRVAVRLGVFADGLVEVSGDLAEGMKVEVPRP